MGSSVDVLYLNVFGRNDCCGGYVNPPGQAVTAGWGWPAGVTGQTFFSDYRRNWAVKWTIGDSTDWNYGYKCTQAPNDITPPCNQNNGVTWDTCANTGLSVAQCALDPNCYAGTNVVTQVGKPLTALFQTFPCVTRGRFVTAYKDAFPTGWGENQIMLGEVQVIANKLLNQPAPRAFMASAAYAGSMVFFGGSDSSGFRYNDVRFFDMLRSAWFAPFSPLGTPPTARAYGSLVLLPSLGAASGLPSSRLALFGGFSNTDQLNDISVLSYPQCPALPQQGVQGTPACVQGGSVCFVTCAGFATNNNGPNSNPSPLVCQTDGTWRGNMPPCLVATPGAPTNVLATVDATGVATVTWTPSSDTGYPVAPIGLTSFVVRTAQTDVVEYYSGGSFPAFAPTAVSPGCPGNAPCTRTGSTYIGGNWYRLLEKNGYPPWMTFTPTTNVWDFWNGYLRLNSDIGRNNWYDQMDDMGASRRAAGRRRPSHSLALGCHDTRSRHACGRQAGWRPSRAHARCQR